jgi:hypothetical protein
MTARMGRVRPTAKLQQEETTISKSFYRISVETVVLLIHAITSISEKAHSKLFLQ